MTSLHFPNTLQILWFQADSETPINENIDPNFTKRPKSERKLCLYTHLNLLCLTLSKNAFQVPDT